MAPGQLRDRIEAGEFASERVSAWRTAMEQIMGDLQTLQLGRSVIARLAEVVRANPLLQTPNTFLEMILRWYAVSTLVTIERDVQDGRKVVSLYRLLDEIARYPSELTREKFRLLYTGSTQRGGGDPRRDVGAFVDARMIDGTYDGFGRGDALDVAVVRGDIAELDAAAKPIVKLRNTAYAHRAAAGPALDSLTLGELHAFVDVVDRLVMKYHNLLFFVSLLQTTPVDNTGWESIFRFPWIATGERNEVVPRVPSPQLVLTLFKALPPAEQAAVRAALGGA